MNPRAARARFANGALVLGPPSPMRLGLLIALCVASVVGCGEGETYGGGRPGSTCQGEDVPPLGDDFFPQIASGDIQLVETGFRAVHEHSLITGEVTPLFELEESAFLIGGVRSVAIDERDIFQVSTDGIHRFDRATRELSLFAPHPEPEEDPVLPRDPEYGPIAISETHLASLMTDRFAWNSTTDLYPNYMVALIERATGARRFIPVERPIGRLGRLYAHGNRFFHAFSVDTDDNPYGVAGEIQAFDIETGTPEPFLTSRLSFILSFLSESSIQFWQDSMLVTMVPEGSVFTNLVRVPVSGGEPEIIATDVRDAFAVSGNEAFVTLYHEAATGVSRQLTAIDLTNGATGAIGTCGIEAFHGSDHDMAAFHGSDDHIYVRAGIDRLLRITP